MAVVHDHYFPGIFSIISRMIFPSFNDKVFILIHLKMIPFHITGLKMDKEFSSNIIQITERFLQRLHWKHEASGCQSAAIGKGACNCFSSSDDHFLDIYTAHDKGQCSHSAELNKFLEEPELRVHTKSMPYIQSSTKPKEHKTHSLPPYLKLQSMPSVKISAVTGLRTPKQSGDSHDHSTRPKCPGLRSKSRAKQDINYQTGTKGDISDTGDAVHKDLTPSVSSEGENSIQTTRKPFESFRYPKQKTFRKLNTPRLVPDSTNAHHELKQTDNRPISSQAKDGDLSACNSNDDTSWKASNSNYNESRLSRSPLHSDSYQENTTEPQLAKPKSCDGFESQSLLSNVTQSARSDPPLKPKCQTKITTLKEHENQPLEPPDISQSGSAHLAYRPRNESANVNETCAKPIQNNDVTNTHVNVVEPPKSASDSPAIDHDNAYHTIQQDEELQGAVGGIDPHIAAPGINAEVQNRRPKLKAKRNRRKKNIIPNNNVPNKQSEGKVINVKSKQNDTESKHTPVKDTEVTTERSGVAFIPKETKAKETVASSNDILVVKTECTDGEEGLQAIRAENKRLKEAKQCRICRDNDANRMFLPCAHLAACSLCSPAVQNCPQCKAVIRGIVSVYFG